MPSKIDVVADSACTVSVDGKKVLIKPVNPSCRATCTSVQWDLLKNPKEPLALDIEFQEHREKGAEKWGHRMGRIAIVNTRRQTVLNTYVRYEYDAEVSTKMPPPVFGVTRKDLYLRNGARESMEVERELKKVSLIYCGHPLRTKILTCNAHRSSPAASSSDTA